MLNVLSPRHPVWMCGMRPFFLLTALAALTLMLLWLLFLSLALPLPASAGGPFAWHAHELLSGFAFASVVGFLLTAAPEFTGSEDYPPHIGRRLVWLWCAARLAFWSSGLLGAPGIVLSGLLHVGLIGVLAALVAPRLWRDPLRAHLSFIWTLLALGFCEAGFHLALLSDEAQPMAWLYASVGVYMVLIVVALSRISMRIVNQALADAGQGIDYLTRPPRRNLLICCIALYSLAEFTLPGSHFSGWLALAAAASVFNLMNDWHVGRALLQRRPLMLYLIYVCMGTGYLLIGLSLLTPLGALSGGRHLLLAGALGLAILAAMSIAGRAHCGLEADARAWLPAAVVGLVLAAGIRAAAGCLLPDPRVAWLLAGALWCLVFALYLIHLAPTLLGPRSDGASGCHGVLEEH